MGWTNDTDRCLFARQWTSTGSRGWIKDHTKCKVTHRVVKALINILCPVESELNDTEKVWISREWLINVTKWKMCTYLHVSNEYTYNLSFFWTLGLKNFPFVGGNFFSSDCLHLQREHGQLGSAVEWKNTHESLFNNRRDPKLGESWSASIAKRGVSKCLWGPVRANFGDGE